MGRFSYLEKGENLFTERLAIDVNSLRAGSQKLSSLMKQKGLQCHPTKTVFLIVGNKRYREQAKKEIEDDPVMFGKFKMNLVENELYLGDMISSQGMENSVQHTIEKRLSKVNGAMYEAKSIIEDFRMQAMGGMAGAWDLWERAIIPSLLANCGSWVGIGKQSYKTLNEIQFKYLRMIYSCPPSTPCWPCGPRRG